MQEWKACVRRMVEYIEARIGDTPSLYDIAARRLAFVAAVLRNAQESVAQIALEFGFSLQTALTRAFKNAYGISPSKYRRKPIPIPQQIHLNIPFEINEKGERFISEFKTLDVRTEYIPASWSVQAHGDKKRIDLAGA